MTETPDTPRARIKSSAEAAPLAADLLLHLLGDGRTLMGAESGDIYAETIGGHSFIAYRLRCGGVEVREVVG